MLADLGEVAAEVDRGVHRLLGVAAGHLLVGLVLLHLVLGLVAGVEGLGGQVERILGGEPADLRVVDELLLDRLVQAGDRLEVALGLRVAGLVALEVAERADRGGLLDHAEPGDLGLVALLEGHQVVIRRRLRRPSWAGGRASRGSPARRRSPPTSRIGSRIMAAQSPLFAGFSRLLSFFFLAMKTDDLPAGDRPGRGPCIRLRVGSSTVVDAFGRFDPGDDLRGAALGAFDGLADLVLRGHEGGLAASAAEAKAHGLSSRSVSSDRGT